MSEMQHLEDQSGLVLWDWCILYTYIYNENKKNKVERYFQAWVPQTQSICESDRIETLKRRAYHILAYNE